jgi:peptidoglycan/xylan/chitin deacetylase (PgdA/CDA1 family)
MADLRVLLLSNTRPSRVWRFANHLMGKGRGVEICGIVQRPVSNLALAQRLIATDNIDPSSLWGSGWPRGRYRARTYLNAFIDRVLWIIHGCPHTQRPPPIFTCELLQEKCAQAGWRFLQAEELEDKSVADFIQQSAPDLMIALGDMPSFPTVSAAPAHGWIVARENEARTKIHEIAETVHIRIEQLSTSSGAPQTLASLSFPRQPRDEMLGLTLKTDLLIDDMLTLAVAAVQAERAGQPEKLLTRWVEEILVPYLVQVGPSQLPGDAPLAAAHQWLRSRWSLCLQTALLCSPLVIGRNWVRRWRHRYPVLILTHHLVSDRKHRMGMSTEAFWRQVRFLRKHYRIVSLSEAAEMLQTGRVDAPSVSLTFDDGYADNFVSLRAVAEEVNIPVSLFITTQPVSQHTEFQHDVAKGDYGAFPMTWGQIRYWKSRGAEFGSHTRTHVRCGLVDEAALEDEIVGSRDDFEAKLGAPPRFFAFPYGDHQNMPRRAMKVAASAYPHVLSSCGGENFPDAADTHSHLRRKKAYAEPWELELELQSVFDLVERLKRSFRKMHDVSPSVTVELALSRHAASVEQAITPENGATQFVAESAPGIRQLAKPQ